MKNALIIILCLSLSVQLLAADHAIYLYQDKNGLAVKEFEGFANQGSNYFTIDDPSIIWTHYVEWPIYTTTANCGAGYTFAGTYLNDPKEAELFSAAGGGIPEWVYPGTEFYVDASDDGDVLAAADENLTGVSLIKWTGTGSAIPAWTANIPNVVMSSYGPYFLVSSDGSTIAIVVNDGGTSRLLMYDQNSSIPVVDYTATGYGFPRCLQISADGRYAALRAFTDIIVYDRDLNSPRDIINIGYSTTPADISGNGDLLAYGWTTMNVLEWTGVDYSQIWTTSQPGYSLSKVSISEDGSTIAAGWYNSNFSSVRLTIYNSTSSVPIWTYTYPTSSGVWQEYISDIELSYDGRYIIAGSYGDNANINPEVHIFDRNAGATPYYTVDMPGSVFSVDIGSNGNYASACGKHIHANVSGHGGDIVAIDLDLTISNVSITLIPQNPPIQIPAIGGSFDFNIEVENSDPSPVTIDIWTMVTLPNGSEYGPIINVPDFIAPANWSGDRDRTQIVPAGAPTGMYTYDAYIGDFPDIVVAEDHFDFEKLAVTDGGPMIYNWDSWGEEFDDFGFVSVSRIPSEFGLYPVYPNPFNPTTNISFNLQSASNVNLSVYDVNGREVANLVNEYKPVGSYEVTFDASNLVSGVYFVRLTVDGGQSMVQKVVLMK